MHGRCRAGKVVYLVDLGRVGLCYVVADKLEVVVGDEMTYVVLAACEVIVETYDIIPVFQKSFAQV